ncbi:DUF924 family protein [Paracoccus sp. MC1862]|uniref:DUF924 family protein n=1 Tax=Paracoccus sp. MC1862 TaxID=2760307 RepID=UPI001600DE97|nr:DUF924 family protein [Paracoccus sp. MC1862]MBB1498124.1 DUF924 domain-containing protein [Paracoccus sp. MC1862]QQO46195.1 DUF924 domain-containing protein [Paracoccus sp. MC1862]
MNEKSNARAWRDVLEFWFPEESALDLEADTQREHWFRRMRGGADSEIIARFSDLTAEGAKGNLDHWASDAEGRLALIIVLDQFSRSLWRGEVGAFAQDRAALALAMGGLANRHYTGLASPWLRIVFGLPLGHCEGRDHLERLDLLIRLREDIAAQAPADLQPIYLSLVTQAHDVRKVIAAFGRHPHRNQTLGRQSTPAEEAYIAEGRFPHLRAFEE